MEKYFTHLSVTMKKLISGMLLILVVSGVSAQITWMGTEYTTLSSNQYLGDEILFEIQSFPIAPNQGAQVYIDWGNNGYGSTLNTDYFTLNWIENVGNNSKWNKYVIMQSVGTHNRKYLGWQTGQTDYNTSDMGTFTVLNLNYPSSLNGSASSISQINLTWSLWNSKNVMVVRSLTSASASDVPVNGTTYTIGSTLGTGTVVYNSNGTSFSNTGLTPNTSYTYTFYSVNNGYYSAGSSISASTMVQTFSPTDHFRSNVSTSGTWGSAGNWQSSPDNINWITATAAPTSSAASTTIQTGHTITLVAAQSAKNLVINGTLDLTSRTLTIATSGSIINNSSFICGSGTVSFSGSATVSGSFIFNNISIAGACNFNVTPTINGIFTISGVSGSINLAPMYGPNSTLKYSTGSGTSYNRSYEWSSEILDTPGCPYAVNITNGTKLILGANSGVNLALVCGASLTIDAQATLDLNTSPMTANLRVKGELKNNGTIDLSSPVNGGNLVVEGNFESYGTLNCNGKKIILEGENIQKLSVASVDYLKINKTFEGVQLQTNLVCTGIDGGNAIEISGSDIFLDLFNKTLTIGSAGKEATYNTLIATPGYISGNAGSLVINGQGDFGTLFFDPASEESSTLANLTINRSSGGSVTIGNTLAIKSNLIVTAGAMVISPGVAVTSTATTTNSAGNTGIVLKSDATGTASFLIETETNPVSATVERYINNADWTNWQDGWHFISSPVASQAISPAFTTDPYDFYTWYEASNEWVNFKNTTTAPTWNDVNGSTNFTVGKGYMVAYDEAGTKSFAGTLNVSNVAVSGLVITGTTQTNRSWHLLGNPFSTALIWDATLDNDWLRTNIAGIAKIWNEAGQAYSDLNSSLSSIIPATNGFMVQVVSGTGSLTIPAGKRVHSSQAFYKSSTEEFPGFKLIASPVDYSSFQESLVLVDANASNDYDLMLDGEFLAGYAPQFYSRITDMNLSTNSLPFIDETTQIPFGFVKNTASDYTIELKESIEGYKVFLKDLKANVDHNLTANPVYTFTSLEGDDANRFLLHFESTLGTDDTEKPEQLSMYYNNGSVYVSGAAGKAELFVRNMLGQVVIQQAVNGDGLQVVNTGNLADGVYVVSLVGSGSTKSQKIVIK